jgi:hypothetical protein
MGPANSKFSHVRFARPAQPIDATQALNLSAGVSNCKVSCGRWQIAPGRAAPGREVLAAACRKVARCHFKRPSADIVLPLRGVNRLHLCTLLD